MIDPRSRHQHGEQTQNQGVVRTRSHARSGPDYRPWSVAWKWCCPRLGSRQLQNDCAVPSGRGRRPESACTTPASPFLGAPSTPAWRLLARSCQRLHAFGEGVKPCGARKPCKVQAAAGAARCPALRRQRAGGEGLSCGNDTSP
ncbi:hypothetical protein XMIN_2803 [Xanthomonas citri pv. mangiferaeindicae LMG 941]|nr:hypothetical protein XMIN_2803 [Xanthomonas citri pv. mangiferaeindicae LMG 941]